jgi:hypothetical protein
MPRKSRKGNEAALPFGEKKESASACQTLICHCTKIKQEARIPGERLCSNGIASRRSATTKGRARSDSVNLAVPYDQHKKLGYHALKQMICSGVTAKLERIER